MPAFAAFQGTQRVSVDSAGIEGNRLSNAPSISLDGRYVAFFSEAQNLVAGDSNGNPDVFVHHWVSGLTTRVSVTSAGVQGNHYSQDPSLSLNGKFIAFASLADNLVAGDFNNRVDVFVHDMQSGVTERVSVDSNGVEAVFGDSLQPSISVDGRYVAFESAATNLVAGDSNGVADVFVHDRQTGITERVSVDSAALQANGASTEPSITGGGRWIAFTSTADNLVPGDLNQSTDVFVHDRQLGTTVRASVDALGQEGATGSRGASLAALGPYLTFETTDALVPWDVNGVRDVYFRDLEVGVTSRVSVDALGLQASAKSLASSICQHGRFVAFSSCANDLVADDLNGKQDVFVCTLWTGSGDHSIRLLGPAMVQVQGPAEARRTPAAHSTTAGCTP